MDSRSEDDEEILDIDRKPLDLLDVLGERNPEETTEEEAPAISGDLEKILGDDPSKTKREVNLHPTLVARWKDWIVRGLSRDVLDGLTEKYPRTGNVNFEPPTLNPEVSHSLKETAQKRDKHFVYAQCLAGTALSSLGMAITCLLKEDAIDKLKLLELLSDAAKLLIQVHHKESCARIAYILPGMSKQIKAVLEETIPGTLLFGHGLTEKLQDAIALEKLGKEIKAQQETLVPTKSNPKTPGSSKWKKPPGKRPGFNPNHDNWPRTGPNRNYHHKNRPTPYRNGPSRFQNQGRQQNRQTDQRRRS